MVVDVKGVEMDLWRIREAAEDAAESCRVSIGEKLAARGAVEVVERESCESRCWSACGPVEQGALCTRNFEKQNMVCGTLF